jgi:Ca2+-binding EF-hand superfamily protein
VRKALRNLSQATPPSALKKALLQLTLNLVLPSEDLKEALEAFRELDTELKGSVSETQLRAPIFRLFPDTQAQDALTAIASIAQDHQLTYSEFLLGAACPTNHHFLKTFHILDREKDGTITGKELREFLSVPLGNSFDLHPWRVLISAISHSTEGSFQYTDFLSYMRSP